MSIRDRCVSGAAYGFGCPLRAQQWMVFKSAGRADGGAGNRRGRAELGATPAPRARAQSSCSCDGSGAWAPNGVSEGIRVGRRTEWGGRVLQASPSLLWGGPQHRTIHAMDDGAPVVTAGASISYSLDGGRRPSRPGRRHGLHGVPMLNSDAALVDKDTGYKGS